MAAHKQTGQPIRLTADEQNRWNATAEKVLGRMITADNHDPRTPGVSQTSVKVRNETCADRRRGDLLEVCEYLLRETDPRNIWLSAAIYWQTGCYGILRRPLIEDEIGELQLDGVCFAYVDVTDEGHNHATAVAGSVTLQSAETGPVDIAWKPAGAGQLECVVILNQPCGERTTTTTSTTLDPTAGDTSCYGDCKWVWSATTLLWTLDIDNCQTTTTTTPDPTTTTTPCICTSTATTPCPTGACEIACVDPGPPLYPMWILQSGECSDGCYCNGYLVGGTCDPLAPNENGNCGDTTTTTTADPCACIQPDFCGVNDGDCTFTNCAPSIYINDVPDCGQSTPPPTTTTTCDCDTTTTASGCADGCDWIWVPVSGWELTNSGCPDWCPCSEPTYVQPSPKCCVTVHTDCGAGTGTPGCPPECDGYCHFCWYPHLQSWRSGSIFQDPPDDGCASFCCSDCRCVPPSSPPPDPNDPCSEAWPPCLAGPDCQYGGAHGTTTAEPPWCWECYTSTTTTTADPARCNNGCVWSWNGATWSAVSDDCASHCECPEPVVDGQDAGCEITYTPCRTTTTTTTTTTTAAPTTTTSTTTTTCDPCSWAECGIADSTNKTLFYCVDNQTIPGTPAYFWAFCDEDCSPGYSPWYDWNTGGSCSPPCACAAVPCIEGDFSTTTTTTTTPDPATTTTTTPCPCPAVGIGMARFLCEGGSWSLCSSNCQTGTPPDPESICGPCTTDCNLCDASCDQTTTTTTSCPTGYCAWICGEGGLWWHSWNTCLGDCECPPQGTNGAPTDPCGAGNYGEIQYHHCYDL